MLYIYTTNKPIITQFWQEFRLDVISNWKSKRSDSKLQSQCKLHSPIPLLKYITQILQTTANCLGKHLKLTMIKHPSPHPIWCQLLSYTYLGVLELPHVSSNMHELLSSLAAVHCYMLNKFPENSQTKPPFPPLPWY